MMLALSWRSMIFWKMLSWSMAILLAGEAAQPGGKHILPFIRGSEHAVLRLSLQIGDDVIDGAAVEDVHALGGLVGVVRRKDDVGARENGVAGGQGLGVEDVQA